MKTENVLNGTVSIAMVLGSMLAISLAFIVHLKNREKQKADSEISARARIEELAAALETSEETAKAAGAKVATLLSERSTVGLSGSTSAEVAALRQKLRESEKMVEDQALVLKNTFTKLDAEKGERLFEANSAKIAAEREAQAAAAAVGELQDKLRASEVERVEWKQRVPPLEARVAALESELEASQSHAKDEERLKQSWWNTAKAEEETVGQLRRELERVNGLLAAAQRDANVVEKAHTSVVKKLQAEHARALESQGREASTAHERALAALAAGRDKALDQAQRSANDAKVHHTLLVKDLSADVGRLQNATAGALAYGGGGGRGPLLLAPGSPHSSGRAEAPSPFAAGKGVSLTPTAAGSSGAGYEGGEIQVFGSGGGGVYQLYCESLSELTKVKDELRELQGRVGAFQEAAASAEAERAEACKRADAAAAGGRAEGERLRRELAVVRARAQEVPEGFDGAAEILLAKTDAASARSRAAEAQKAEAAALADAAAARVEADALRGKISELEASAQDAHKAHGRLQASEARKLEAVKALEAQVRKLEAQVLASEASEGADAARSLRRHLSQCEASLKREAAEKEAAEARAEEAERGQERAQELLAQAELNVARLQREARDKGLLANSLRAAVAAPPAGPPAPGGSAGGARPLALLEEAEKELARGAAVEGDCGDGASSLLSTDSLAFAASEVGRLERALEGKEAAAASAQEAHAKKLGEAKAGFERKVAELEKQRAELERQLSVARATADARAAQAAAAAAAAAAPSSSSQDKVTGDGKEEEEEEKCENSRVLSKKLAHAEMQVSQEKRLFASLSLQCDDTAGQLAAEQSNNLLLKEELRECRKDLRGMEDELGCKDQELTVHRSLLTLRGTSARHDLSELASSPRMPLPPVEATAKLAWTFLRVFEREAGVSPKFVGPPQVALGSSSSSGGSGTCELPDATWLVCRAVFAPGHHLAAALERISPQVVAQPKYAAAVEALSELATKKITVADVHDASPACAVVWAWAVATLACSESLVREKQEEEAARA